ncbi:MAG: SRPBCC domain-containing protein [Brachybacterium sp.]|nr:SRPBCC domain-containing protein [Brachybacterium sp.]
MTVTESLPVVDAVRRSLEIDEQIPEGPGRVRVVLTLTTNIACAPAQLWPLLTRRRELAHWFGPVSGELYEGGRFEAPAGAGGRIVQVQEPHRLGLTWKRAAGEEPLLLRLDPEDDGTTLLALRHTALLDAEEFARTGPGSLALGWEIALLSLAAHTDGWGATCLAPVPVPTPEWLRGPQGARYVRAWSVRWAAEAIAAGVDESSARQGESETVRRYLER